MTVQTWSPEEIVDDVVDLLSATLPSALDAVYAKYAARDAAAGRSIEYVAPRPGANDATPSGDYYPGGASELLRYPAIEVSLPDLTLDGFSLGLADADAADNLVIVAWESAARNDTTLWRKAQRLSAAVFDVLATPGALGGATITRARLAWRFNPEQQENDEIQTGALLVLTCSSTLVHP